MVLVINNKTMALDNDVVNLAKAIRQMESGNRAVLPGEGSQLGGASRYQYTHGTWKNVAGKYLGNANAELNLENENKATYLRIKDWKDKGYNPAQIASMWNAGEGKPNAYKENWRGVNKYGVKYDTPAYVNKVYNEYKKQKELSQKYQPTVPAGKPIAQPAEQKKGIFSRIGSFITKDILGGGVEKETNLGGDIVRATIGSQGLAGIAQMPGKVLSLPAQAKSSQMLSDTAGGLAEQATLYLQQARNETDPTKRNMLIQKGKELYAQSQQISTQRDEISGDILTPGKTIATTVNAGLTAPMLATGGVAAGATPVAAKLGAGKLGTVASGLYGEGALAKTALSKLGVSGKVLTAGKGVVPRAIEQAGLGAGFTASENIRAGRPIGENLLTGAGFGAAIPFGGLAASKTKQAIAPVRDKAAQGVLNSLIKPLMKDLAFEKNPSRGLLKRVGVFNNFDEGITKTEGAIRELSANQKRILSNPIMAGEKMTIKKEVGEVFDNAINKAAKENDQASVNRLVRDRDAIFNEMAVDNAGNLVKVKARDLDNLTPEQLFDIKVLAGNLRKWTGNASEDKASSRAIGAIYGKIKNKLNTLSDDYGLNLREVNEDLSDLITAKKVMEYRDILTKRQNIFSLPGKLATYGTGIAGAISLNPVALVGAVALGGLDRLLGSVAFKTRLAKFLSTASAKERSMLLQNPQTANLVKRIFGEDLGKKIDETKILEKINKYILPDDLKMLPEGKTQASINLPERIARLSAKESGIVKTNLGTKQNIRASQKATGIGVYQNIKKNEIKDFKRDLSLSDKDAQIQERAIEKFVNNKDELINEYMNKYPNLTANADLARTLFKDVGYNGANSKAVHEPASALNKLVWKKVLQTAPGPDSVLYAGGSGSGKTSVAKEFVDALKYPGTPILDGNLASFNSAEMAIKESLQAGKIPNIVYIYREPVDAFSGTIQRTLTNPSEGGRIVPISVTASNHPSSNNVVKQLYNKYGDKIKFIFIDNSKGAGKAIETDFNNINKILFSNNLEQQMKSKAKEYFNKGFTKNGKTYKLTKEQYNKLME